MTPRKRWGDEESPTPSLAETEAEEDKSESISVDENLDTTSFVREIEREDK